MVDISRRCATVALNGKTMVGKQGIEGTSAGTGERIVGHSIVKLNEMLETLTDTPSM